jgi:hypothetical protein
MNNMFLAICEVCKADRQFKTVEMECDRAKKKVNVCMDCSYMLEDFKKDDDPRYKLFFEWIKGGNE